MEFEMTNIAIVGARDAEYLLSQIERNCVEWNVKYIGDNSLNVIGKKIKDVRVIKNKDLRDVYCHQEVDKIVIAVRKGYSRYCILNQMLELGIKQEDILLLKPSPLTHRQSIIFDNQNEQYLQYWFSFNESQKSGKTLIHHLETHAADGCNLNCCGCLHFSNLYKKDEFPNWKNTIKDLQYIAKYCEIFQFRILGGEPLLNPELSDFIEEVRKVLPNTDIAVISNGVLIPKMKPRLYQVMKKNNVGFNLTLYPPTLKIKEAIYETLERYGVAYGSHEVQMDEFEKYIRLTPEYDGKAHEKCISRGILTLKDGKLYKCPTGIYISRYFEYFQDIKVTPMDKGIDIYEKDMNWNEVIRNLTVEKGAHCNYCSEYHEKYKWNNNKPQKGDWIVG